MCLLGRSGLSLSSPSHALAAFIQKCRYSLFVPFFLYLALPLPCLSFILLPFDAPLDATRTLPANLPYDEDESLRARTR